MSVKDAFIFVVVTRRGVPSYNLQHGKVRS